MLSRFRPYLVLAALWLLYFHPLVLHPTQVLYADYSDLLAEHLPGRIFLVREWRETGELPLWNPYHFCGSPFVHDIQVGTFYPPYAVTLLFPESVAGSLMSWVIALHVLAAGAFTFLYARSIGLGEVGSLVAAVGFMLSAKWMTHLLLAGHTITVGLAWLPLVLLGLEGGIRTGRVWPVVGAGVAFALMLLGTHTQWAFYSGVFAAVWTLGLALTRSNPSPPAPLPGGARGENHTLREVGRWLLCGLGVVAVAVPLVAVQLLPTWEAAGQSARTVGLQSTGAFQVGFHTLFGLVGPSFGNDPPRTWEQRGIFGLFWLAAALAAPAVAGGQARWRLGVFLGLLAFSLGGAVLLDWLPGFRMFRIPTRMLLVAIFPLAILAGTTTDALVRSNWATENRKLLVRPFLLAAALGGLSLFASQSTSSAAPLWTPFVAYWVAVAVALPVFVWLVRPGSVSGPRVRTGCWLVVLLAELVAPIATFPAVRPQSEIYPKASAVEFLADHTQPGEARVIDIDKGTKESDKMAVMGGGSPLALAHRIETTRGYNPIDVRHYREYIGFIVNLNEPVLALSPIAQPVIPNFEITNPALFDFLNVRYVACPLDHVPPTERWELVGEFPHPPAVPAYPPGALRELPPHHIYRNKFSLSRAQVVPVAEAMPAGQELAALKRCRFDQTVLLTTTDPLPPNGTQPARGVRITEYRPNRVTIDLGGQGGGFLVLADVWFPGWVCRVDGVEVPVYRANHAFRAVAIPDGAKEAVFRFEPWSYRIGWWVSAMSLALLTAVALGRVVLAVVWKQQ